MLIQEDEFHPSLSNSESEIETCFFNHYSRTLLVEAIKNYLSLSIRKTNEPWDKSMFSVISKLLQRREIEKTMRDEIAIEVCRAYYHLYHQMSNNIRKSDEEMKEDFLMQVNGNFNTKITKVS